jgi:hypothetical protein
MSVPSLNFSQPKARSGKKGQWAVLCPLEQNSEGYTMKRVGLLVACASLAFVVGCAVGSGDPGPDNEPVAADKAPSTDLGHVHNGPQSEGVVAAPASGLTDDPGIGTGPAGTPGVKGKTHL